MFDEGLQEAARRGDADRAQQRLGGLRSMAGRGLDLQAREEQVHLPGGAGRFQGRMQLDVGGCKGGLEVALGDQPGDARVVDEGEVAFLDVDQRVQAGHPAEAVFAAGAAHRVAREHDGAAGGRKVEIGDGGSADDAGDAGALEGIEAVVALEPAFAAHSRFGNPVEREQDDREQDDREQGLLASRHAVGNEVVALRAEAHRREHAVGLLVLACEEHRPNVPVMRFVGREGLDLEQAFVGVDVKEVTALVAHQALGAPREDVAGLGAVADRQRQFEGIAVFAVLAAPLHGPPEHGVAFGLAAGGARFAAQVVAEQAVEAEPAGAVGGREDHQVEADQLGQPSVCVWMILACSGDSGTGFELESNRLRISSLRRLRSDAPSSRNPSSRRMRWKLSIGSSTELTTMRSRVWRLSTRRSMRLPSSPSRFASKPSMSRTTSSSSRSAACRMASIRASISIIGTP
uniref:hypothetical protein n=1 Tax=Aromatoleum toluclasticum TaxID=92003 RepID=UPI0012F9A55B